MNRMFTVARAAVCTVLCVAMLFTVVACKPNDKPVSGSGDTTAPEGGTTLTTDVTTNNTSGETENTTDNTSDATSVAAGTTKNNRPATTTTTRGATTTTTRAATTTTRPATAAPTAAPTTTAPVTESNMKGIGKVWMMPRNDSFYELFTNLDQWKETRKVVDAVGFADHALKSLFTPSKLEEGFAGMREIKMPLVLEVGGIKEWGAENNDGKGIYYGKKMFEAQNPTWQHFIDLGADFGGITMDEPLLNVRHSPVWNYVGNNEQKFEFAVEGVAEFIKHVRMEYPNLVVGDIEVAPTFTANYLIRWIDALEARVKEKTGRGMDNFRMDVNWAALRHNQVETEKMWRDMKRVEDHCRSIGLPFSMIYWASAVGDFRLGSAYDEHNNQTWYDQIMDQGEKYRAAGGKPDQYVIETWVNLNGTPMPPTLLPETKSNSFTRSVLDFYNKFIK